MRYPEKEQTVPECICQVGASKFSCPYMGKFYINLYTVHEDIEETQEDDVLE